MSKQTTLFIDNRIFENPDVSSKWNRVNHFLIPLLGVFLIIAGVIGIIEHKSNAYLIMSIIQIISGSFLATVEIFQRLFYKMTGRLFISFAPEFLEIKTKYLRPARIIDYNQIEKVQFHFSKIIIFLNSGAEEKIQISLPFTKVEAVRQKFRETMKDKVYPS